MKKTARLVSTLALCIAASGCSTAYYAQRGRDASDIVTATLGFGAGARARVGPVQAGLLWNTDVCGLRGGALGQVVCYETHTREAVAPYPFRAPSLPDAQVRLPKRIFGNERYHVGDYSTAVARRGKAYEAVSAVPFVSVADEPEYYTQVEAVVGILVTLRLGLNVGELVDFVLGWTTIDIYGDDLRREQTEGEVKSTP